MQNNTLKTTSAADGFPFVMNINIAPKQHIWTSILHYRQNSLSLEKKITATSDMHKYGIKIQYGNISRGFSRAEVRKM